MTDERRRVIEAREDEEARKAEQFEEFKALAQAAQEQTQYIVGGKYVFGSLAEAKASASTIQRESGAIVSIEQMPAGLTAQEQFFYLHAGFSYDAAAGESAEQGRIRCAKQLASAERAARKIGLVFSWEPDWTIGYTHANFYSDEAYPHQEPETCETCAVYAYDEDGALDETPLASLGCIDDATPEYRRVVEAELAAEVIAEYGGAAGLGDSHGE